MNFLEEAKILKKLKSKWWMRYLGNMVVHEEHVQCNNSIQFNIKMSITRYIMLLMFKGTSKKSTTEILKIKTKIKSWGMNLFSCWESQLLIINIFEENIFIWTMQVQQLIKIFLKICIKLLCRDMVIIIYQLY